MTAKPQPLITLDHGKYATACKYCEEKGTYRLCVGKGKGKSWLIYMCESCLIDVLLDLVSQHAESMR